MSLIKYIEQLERQIAERDTEIAKLKQDLLTSYGESEELSGELQKYRDAPVVAWRYELKAGEYTFSEKRYLDETYAPRLKPLIVKPGE